VVMDDGFDDDCVVLVGCFLKNLQVFVLFLFTSQCIEG
jgi:hypothetical protein